METDDGTVMMPFDPEWVGRLPATIFAVKYRDVCQDGKIRTYIFLLGSKSAYDQRIAGPEKGQGLQGEVVWTPITPPPPKVKKAPQEESLF
jgi:hypothetical protein